MTIVGISKYVFGLPVEMKPISGLPEGRARVRFRAKQFAKVFVRTESGIAQYLLTDEGNHWFAHLNYGKNITLRQ